MTFYIYLIFAFLLGGIPFGLLLGYIFGQGDIRKKGSGNIGAANVWRVAGPPPAILALIGDIGKGTTAVLLCGRFYDPAWPVTLTTACLMAGVVVVLGHVFSPYLAFRGGKGVNTALGVFISLLPAETLIALGVFLIVVFVFRYISLSSMAAAIAFMIVIWVERFALHKPVADIYLAVSVLLAGFIIYTHRQNIKRLLAGTENRFQLKKVSD